jgi:predicted membrane-bound mannosyltransferase
MEANIATFAISTFLHDIRAALEEAAGLVKAADACAGVGQLDRATEIANDADDLIHDAEKLLGMATHLSRLSAEDQGSERDSEVADTAPPLTPIDSTLALATITAFLGQARERMNTAVGIARAADICAGTGKPQEGVRLALDLEPLLRETRLFIDTASLVNRLSTT